ncbi:anti-sigma factor domain-containing protein [Cohnella candidum]|uniref:Anti-sigma factor domain-containing protein n=1 Tax=Cohnella candidum TaxID=2674991 RepID=A0A3G3JZE0_9BACL|nr:anti-sigma factor domain-containing protein [Cohnella candidum]AYQ73625.1 anti-sigma factor domain-containing protein [Cohnella candidum]
MNRGTVMEKKGGTAVLLTPDGQFVRVKASRDAAVGEEIPWTEADRVAGQSASTGRRRRWISAGAFAAALLLFVVALVSFRTPPVVAYVSMDINPSIELGLDAKERVRELRALNEDAAVIVDGVKYKGKPVEDVTKALAGKLAESHILTPETGGDIVIASVSVRKVGEGWEAQVAAKISSVLQEAGTGSKVTQPDSSGTKPSLTIETLYLPEEVREEAQENGLSAGKMAFWLAAENSGREIPLEELQKTSVRKVASDWGGVEKVLKDGKIDKGDKESWKQLLAEAKSKNKQLKETDEDAAKATNQPKTEDDVSADVGKGAGDAAGQDKNKDKDKDKDKEKDKDQNKGKDEDAQGKNRGKGNDKNGGKSGASGNAAVDPQDSNGDPVKYGGQTQDRNENRDKGKSSEDNPGNKNQDEEKGRDPQQGNGKGNDDSQSKGRGQDRGSNGGKKQDKER